MRGRNLHSQDPSVAGSGRERLSRYLCCGRFLAGGRDYQPPGTKRRRLWFAVFAVALLAVAAWGVWRETRPVPPANPNPQQTPGQR